MVQFLIKNVKSQFTKENAIHTVSKTQIKNEKQKI